MQIPSGEGEVMVNSLLVTQGNCNSSSHGLAGVVKNKFQPREAEPRVVGILLSTPTTTYFFGNLEIPPNDQEIPIHGAIY